MATTGVGRPRREEREHGLTEWSSVKEESAFEKEMAV